MTLKLTEHRLDPVPFVLATLSGAKITPEILVIHYTATLDAASVVRAFAAPGAGASAHLVIDSDGAMTQMVEFNRRAAHAGRSSWNGIPSCNGFSIGIELVNPGPLQQTPEGYVETVRRRPWTGGAVHAKHKSGSSYIHWAAYPEAQLDALRTVAALLVSQYRLRDIVGHDDIAPRRKLDPGPAFPMDSLRSLLGERAEDGPDTYEATTVLNVRSGAGTQFAQVGHSPLPKGAIVDVIDVDGAWSLVRTADAVVEGWAFSKYLVPSRGSS